MNDDISGLTNEHEDAFAAAIITASKLDDELEAVKHLSEIIPTNTRNKLIRDADIKN